MYRDRRWIVRFIPMPRLLRQVPSSPILECGRQELTRRSATRQVDVTAEPTAASDVTLYSRRAAHGVSNRNVLAVARRRRLSVPPHRATISRQHEIARVLLPIVDR